MERLPSHESFQRLDAQRELPDRERPLPAERAGTQTRDVGGRRVLGSVDQTEVLATAHLQPRLRHTLAPADDGFGRLDHHALPAGGREVLPPGGRPLLSRRVRDVDHLVARRHDELGRRRRETLRELEMPRVRPVDVGATFPGEHLERRDAHVS